MRITKQKSFEILQSKRQFTSIVFLCTLSIKILDSSVFRITKEFLDNEYHNYTTITATERERHLNFGNHSHLAMFENESTNWWSALSFNN